ncbi:MAG: DUF4214 domain-containing protein [Methyloprofundus sp.]|nr:DUF4214 domain-containing protein [Methyloprofundus sp.]
MILIRYYLIAVLTLFSHSLFAEYNVDYWRAVLADATTQEYASASFLYDLEPDVENCDEGLLTEAAKLRALKALNEVRSLHNLAAVEYSDYYDEQIQQSAFVQKANNILTHYPPDTADCYTQASAEGSSSSNIYSGHRNTDPVEHIIGWMNDASNVSTVSAVGHRRWMIDPFLAYTTYGQTIGPAALKVFGFNEEPAASPLVEVDFVAFPYQQYPYTFFSDLSSDKRTPWSFTVIEDKFLARNNGYDYFTSASISVTNIETGESLDITDRYTDTNSYGIANIVTWSAQNWAYDTWYWVEITDVSMQDGSVQDYSYEVFIDYSGLIDITRPLEAGDMINETFISGQLNRSSDEDTYSVRLAGETTFTGASEEYSNMAYFINLYGSNKQLIHSSHTSFTLFLEDEIYTVEISACNPQNSCYNTAPHYSVDMTPPVIVPPENNVLIENFIKRLYLNILGRPADSGGLAHWVLVLQESSATNVAFGFFNSAEFKGLTLSHAEFVNIIYRTVLGREADVGGLNFWVSELDKGTLKVFILYGFFQSGEMADLAAEAGVAAYSESDDRLFQLNSFVRRFYTNVLGRDADQGGFDSWMADLLNNTRDAKKLAEGFFFSQEFIQQGHDDSRFVEIAYETILGRVSDESGKIFWAGQLSSGMSREELVGGFLNSEEFEVLAAEYGIQVSQE